MRTRPSFDGQGKQEHSMFGKIKDTSAGGNWFRYGNQELNMLVKRNAKEVD